MGRDAPVLTCPFCDSDDIEDVARYFAKSAIFAREGGFDGIELQYGHSSLARQFLSPLTNKRQDEFGENVAVPVQRRNDQRISGRGDQQCESRVDQLWLVGDVGVPRWFGWMRNLT